MNQSSETRAAATAGHTRSARPSGAVKTLASMVLSSLIGAAALLPTPARAVDGCLVLLCLAAPSWSSIAQCVPPVQQVLNDLLHGRPFPTCSMSGAGNNASNRWSNAPSYCPPQYTRETYLESGTSYSCEYAGAVEVDVNGALWTRTWWSLSGDSVTEFTPAAKAQLGLWDTRFDDDYAAWLASQAPAAPTDGSTEG